MGIFRLYLLCFCLAVGTSAASISTSLTFVVPHLSTGADDTPALLAALPSIQNGTYDRVLFEKGVTYHLLTPVNFGTLNNVQIALEGNISLPDSIASVQDIVASPVCAFNPFNHLPDKCHPPVIPRGMVCPQ